MADEKLDTLPADGKIPTDLPAHPDSEYAAEIARQMGGRVDFYVLTGKAGDLKATRGGHYTCSRPTTNYAGRVYYDVPQMRSLEDEARRAKYEENQRPKEAVQPDWRWGEPGTIPVNMTPEADRTKPTHSPNVVIDDPEEVKKRLDMSNVWIPNPEDLITKTPDYLKPKPAAPAPTVPVADLAGNLPSVSPQNPYTAEWVVESAGMRVASTLSQEDAIARWNLAVDTQKKAIAAAAAAKP
ncbi:hypothetical protein ID007_004340 [Salmonella enterica]|nr:hypothetical protein [Salmonella enterica]